MTSDINEALNFLDNYAHQELEQLQKEYADASLATREVLIPNHAGVTDEALTLRGKAIRCALKQIAKVSLSAMNVAITRTQKTERIEDWAMALTSFGALCTTIIAVLPDSQSGLKLGAALFTLLASFSNIYAKSLQRSLFEKDIKAHIKTLKDAQDSADIWSQDLKIYLSPTTPKKYDKEVSDIIVKANELLKSVNKALIELKFEPVKID